MKKHISKKELEELAMAAKTILGDNFDKEEENNPAITIDLSLDRDIGASLVNNVLNGAVGYVGDDLAMRGGASFLVKDVKFIINFKD